MPQITLDDVKRILTQCAGEPQSMPLDGDIREISFEDLGYDSLARLEMAARIQREFLVAIPDEMVDELGTPEAVVRYVTPRIKAE